MKRTLLTAVIWVAAACAAPAASDHVVVERLPAGGIGPQAVVGADGSVHVVYFAGEPGAGDVFYIRRRPDGGYTAPLRVNSQAGSAVVLGTIRGPQLALGRAGRVHVVWNGSRSGSPRPRAFAPVLYSRLNEAGDRFDAQRNLATTVNGADGGSTVAAGTDGHVYVAWHTGDEGVADARRGVYLVRSTDDGLAFGRAERVSPGALGACACCSMRAFVDRQGTVHLLYRAAAGDIDRDTVLLTSTDRGATFAADRLDPWRIGACPMSSMSLAEGPRGLTAASETENAVWFADVSGPDRTVVRPAGDDASKYPAIAYNSAGEMIVAWVPGGTRTGSAPAAWRVVARDGRLTEARGTARGVPRHGLVAVAALADGRFLVLY